MAKKFDLLIHDCEAILPGPNGEALKPTPCDIAITDGKISGLGQIAPSEAKQIIKAQGLIALPGLIDTQVHFREPGYTHKEDLSSGTLSALLGGVTTVFEMPNTNPPTTSALDLADKVGRAKGRVWSHIGFYIGGSGENFDRLKDLEYLPGCVGIKVFVGSSTGNLLLTNYEKIDTILKTTMRPIAFHSEDDALLAARKHIVLDNPGNVHLHPEWRSAEVALSSTKKLVDLAVKNKRRIHILHVSSKEEMEFLKEHKDYVTVETSPQHLTLEAPACYDKLGTLAQMNPPIRSHEHREALWQAINNGTVDVLGSDHAPHTLEEKKQIYPESPSGMPGVQTIFLVMVHHLNAGRITLEKIVELLAHKPAEIFSLPRKGQIKVGYDADLLLFDPNYDHTIYNRDMATRSGWTPFDGLQVKGFPRVVLLKGIISARDGQTIGGPKGEVVEFN